MRLRILLLGAACLLLLAGVLARAVYLQTVRGPTLRALAEDQYVRAVRVPPRRGDILDRHGVPLAQSVDVDSIWIDPTQLADPAKAARALARALHLDPGELEERLSHGHRFAWVKRQVRPDEVTAVKALGLPGVGFLKEPKRFYPQRQLAAQVIGVVGTDGRGLEGLELAFNGDLAGRQERLSSLRDARGRKLLVQGDGRGFETEGDSVVLTLDRQIQYVAEKALGEAVAQSQAVSGVAVVLDPKTGALLALANVPFFNPNTPGNVPPGRLRDRAALDAFEPGSTFKAFTVSAALDAKAIRPDETFYCEDGAYPIGHHVIHDTHRHGMLTPEQVLQVSSNIGAAKIAAALGPDRLADYLRRFGFGERTGLSLPGEARGSVPYARSDIRLATEAFGQGLSVTAVQLAAGYGAIANGGVLMRPYLVDRVVAPDGTVVRQSHPVAVRRVVAEPTAREVVSMLESVVTPEGTAPRAHMDAYRVAGKTGTAQKPDPLGHGYSDKRIASFVGVVPAEDPRLVILVAIDSPKIDHFGGLIAAPAFKEIASFALPYLGVPPSRPLQPSPVAQALGARSRPRASRPATSRAKVPPLAIVTEETAAGTVQVPDLSGKVGRQAVAKLLSVTLEPRLLGSGRVISQTPPAGTRVAPGARVTLELAAQPAGAVLERGTE